MADNNVVFPRKLLKKFILLYKDLPCLWDRENPAYKIKMKRHAAITKLTELVQEFDSGATRVHVLRKIESLRACVRREYKRVQDSRIKRIKMCSEEELYVPHLWYYDLLSFIFKHDEKEYKLMSEAVGTAEDAAETEEEDENNESGPYEGEDFASDYAANDIVEVEEIGSTNKRYLPYEEEPSSSKSKRHFNDVGDEYDAIGINVAAKLRYLPSNMRVLAEKLINDVLFLAQIDGLTSATAISTQDPFKQEAN